MQKVPSLYWLILRNIQIIEACVKNAKLPYETAKNGLEALNKFKASSFDAVVMGMFNYNNDASKLHHF